MQYTPYMTDERDYAPILTTTDLTAPENLKEDATLQEAIKADLQLANASLQIIHQSWKHVTSIAAVCKLLEAQNKAIRQRREVLNLQYGAQSTSKESSVVLPLS